MKTFKTVYAATKSSYGASFEKVFDSLEELKRAIVKHDSPYRKRRKPYSEKSLKQVVEEDGYILYQVDLHEDEEIVFHEYDGQSWFDVEKKVKDTLSKCKRIVI